MSSCPTNRAFYRLFPVTGFLIITERSSPEDLPCLESDKLSNRFEESEEFGPDSNTNRGIIYRANRARCLVCTPPAPMVGITCMKCALIIDEGPGQFALEYENTLGRKLQMRLDASTYEGAVREARSYLGIKLDDLDAAGDQWALE